MAIIGLVGMLFAALQARHFSHPHLWLLTALGHGTTSVLIYVTAVNFRDRYAAVMAGALVATSVTLAAVALLHPAYSPIFMAIAGIWLISERRWVWAAVSILTVTLFIKHDMIFLLLVVAAFSAPRLAGNWGFQIVAALVPCAVVAFFARHVLGLAATSAAHGWVTVLWALGPAILWFVTAFITDLTTASTRDRWLPVTTWLIVFVAWSALAHGVGSLVWMSPAFVATYLISASGIARALPALAGDLPTTWSRYLVASIAVILLLCLRYPSDSHAASELRRTSPTASNHLVRPILQSHVIFKK